MDKNIGKEILRKSTLEDKEYSDEMLKIWQSEQNNASKTDYADAEPLDDVQMLFSDKTSSNKENHNLKHFYFDNTMNNLMEIEHPDQIQQSQEGSIKNVPEMESVSKRPIGSGKHTQEDVCLLPLPLRLHIDENKKKLTTNASAISSLTWHKVQNDPNGRCKRIIILRRKKLSNCNTSLDSNSVGHIGNGGQQKREGNSLGRNGGYILRVKSQGIPVIHNIVVKPTTGSVNHAQIYGRKMEHSSYNIKNQPLGTDFKRNNRGNMNDALVYKTFVITFKIPPGHSALLKEILSEQCKDFAEPAN